ncbi:MAG: uroporphyrinogen-III synthase [Planctomycetaceae bacterium]|nr:uroporphyrinogen-III synthase [Planctomycetaceae bacterium]
MKHQPVVCCFESRRAEEMATLIERNGGSPLTAPSMQEIPIEDNPEALSFITQAIEGQFPLLILMTGVGTAALFDVAKVHQLFDPLIAAMQSMDIIVRGPKPVPVLSNAGLKFAIKAPEPNTWRELLQSMDEAAESEPERFRLSGRRIAIQEYGLPNNRLYEELRSRGALVTRVPVYRWALPDDTTPLESAIRKIVDNNVDILMFTSANQVSNVLSVAESLSLDSAFRTACGRTMVASIGPTCSEALTDQGFRVEFEASPPKMGQMVRGSIMHWRENCEAPR